MNEIFDLILVPRFVSGFIDGIRVDIEFTFNRFPLRLQHFAVEEAPKHNMEPVLFPRAIHPGSRVPLCTVQEDTRYVTAERPEISVVQI